MLPIMIIIKKECLGLFNVWILYNQLNVKYLPVVNLDGENLIKKGFNLLKRKFLK